MVLRTCHFDPECWPWHTWPAGRMHQLPICRTPGGDHVDVTGYGEQRRIVEEALLREPIDDPELQVLDARDIVCLRLFHDNTVKDPEHRRKRGVDRLPDYEETLALAATVAARGCGILLGQHLGVELTYRGLHGGRYGDARGNVSAIAEFIHAAAEIVRPLGVGLWVSTTPSDVIQDAYRADGQMLRAMNDTGTTNYVACGYSLVPECFVKDNWQLDGSQLKWQQELMGRGRRDVRPNEELPVLRDYLGRGQFWSGLCGARGIRAGNVQLLRRYGFKGFSTNIEPNEIEPLAQDFGDRWWADDWDLPLLRLRVSGTYAYRGRTYAQGQCFLPRDRREREYLLSIGKGDSIFEEVRD